MSCGSDSDKWPRPSNMNFAADQRGKKNANRDHFICTKRAGDMLKFNTRMSASKRTSALFMTILKRVKEQPCVFLFSPFLGLGSFSSSQPSAATTKVDLSLR